MNKRNTSKEKMKENRKFPYKNNRQIKSSTGNGTLYICRYCHEKVDFNHICEKRHNKTKLWKNPQSQRSTTLKLLIKHNKVQK